jgi:nitrate/nitrite transporter NarK
MRSLPFDARRWLTMASLILAGEAIYTLPYYLRRDYAPVMVRVSDLTYTELGTLSSMFGVFALLCYFPGGYLADRFSTRVLLATSLVATGLGGLVLVDLPSFPVLLAVFGFWGVTSILTFWGALIKATRNWGRPSEQGKAFGILDGGRGLVGAALASVALVFFQRAGEGEAGLRQVVWFYSITALCAAAAVGFTVPPDPHAAEDRGLDGAGLAERLKRTLRHRAVWLHGVVILAGYTAYWGTFDLAPYAADGYGLGDAQSATFSVFPLWLRFFAAIGAGFLADRVGVGRAVGWAFTTGILVFVSLASVPASAGSTALLFAQAVVMCMVGFALRGIYYALMEEYRLPTSLTGTAVGVVSVIGYTPDIFAPLLSGALIDSFPGDAGHRIYFGVLAAVCGVGLAANRLLGQDVGTTPPFSETHSR